MTTKMVPRERVIKPTWRIQAVPASLLTPKGHALATQDIFNTQEVRRTERAMEITIPRHGRPTDPAICSGKVLVQMTRTLNQRFFNLRQILSLVTGPSTIPSSPSASATALLIAGYKPTAAASPQPFTPSGLVVHLVLLKSKLNAGKSSARGKQ